MKRKNRFTINTYKEGGNKSEWISDKISEIMKEGKYPQDQAIAIAYSMYDNRMQDGGMPEWYKNNPPMFTTEFGSQMTPSTTYNPQPQKTTYTQPPQFFNPYSDVDINTGAQAFGRGLQSGNPLDIIAGGLKTVTGIARNVFGGMGQENVRQEAIKKYYDEQRNLMTTPTVQEGNYFQDGGGIPQTQIVMEQVAQALQQGIDPNQIVQQLIQMGVSQEQAVQMIQEIAQQMQGQSPQEEQMEGQYSNNQEEMGEEQSTIMQNGGEYLNKLIGKKIIGFKLNNETGNYDIEFE